MAGSSKVIHAAPRIMAVAAVLCAVAVVSMIARPQALMQTALSGTPGAQVATSLPTMIRSAWFIRSPLTGGTITRAPSIADTSVTR